MTKISFHKYQGTGNDFIMIDNREAVFDSSDLERIFQLCDRKFGIGADGLILIEASETADFEMVYFNPDGSQSLCGNGSRCAVMFAHHLGLIGTQTTFQAIDGLHEAEIKADQVYLKMHDVDQFEKIGEDYLINTGSPHYIKKVDSTEHLDPVAEGRKVRYADRFKKEGVNVNFVEQVAQGAVKIRTYERGVEDETLSCGTGCTAVALSIGLQEELNEVKLQAMGGDLKVSFDRENGSFTNIYLIGPAKFVFKGQIEV